MIPGNRQIIRQKDPAGVVHARALATDEHPVDQGTAHLVWARRINDYVAKRLVLGSRGSPPGLSASAPVGAGTHATPSALG